MAEDDPKKAAFVAAVYENYAMFDPDNKGSFTAADVQALFSELTESDVEQLIEVRYQGDEEDVENMIITKAGYLAYELEEAEDDYEAGLEQLKEFLGMLKEMNEDKAAGKIAWGVCCMGSSVSSSSENRGRCRTCLGKSLFVSQSCITDPVPSLPPCVAAPHTPHPTRPTPHAPSKDEEGKVEFTGSPDEAILAFCESVQMYKMVNEVNRVTKDDDGQIEELDFNNCELEGTFRLLSTCRLLLRWT